MYLVVASSNFNLISTSERGVLKLPHHSNFLEDFRKYRLVWAVFL